MNKRCCFRYFNNLCLKGLSFTYYTISVPLHKWLDHLLWESPSALFYGPHSLFSKSSSGLTRVIHRSLVGYRNRDRYFVLLLRFDWPAPELQALGWCALVDGADFEDVDLAIDGLPGAGPRLGAPWWTVLWNTLQVLGADLATPRARTGQAGGANICC